MSKIFEAGNLPNEEKVYMKKGWTGWRIVYPIKNEDGSVNYKNLIIGDWWILIKMVFFIALIIGITLAYSHDTKTCRGFVQNINAICLSLDTNPQYNYSYLTPEINLSKFEVSNEEGANG